MSKNLLTQKDRSKLWYQKHKEQKKAYAKKYRDEHKERKAFTDAEYRRRLKLEVFSHYSKGSPVCAFCSETNIEFLTLDHLNGDGLEHRTENNITVGTAT